MSHFIGSPEYEILLGSSINEIIKEGSEFKYLENVIFSLSGYVKEKILEELYNKKTDEFLDNYSLNRKRKTKEERAKYLALFNTIDNFFKKEGPECLFNSIPNI